MSDHRSASAAGARDAERTSAEAFAEAFARLVPGDVPQRARTVAVNDLLDGAGLCVAARRRDYMHALLRGWDGEGACTVLGHPGGRDPAGAALANGTATHGEDFDDTLEGSSTRVGAVVIPAVLAAAERHGYSGQRALFAIACGLEAVCRLNRVAPGAIHRASFHPVGTLGVFGATVGVGMLLGHDRRELTMALGIAGSLSSGINEFRTDREWTKRLHAGWAAHSGYRAALLARGGYRGPRTVFDGKHNWFKAFAPSATPRYEELTTGIGQEWLMEHIVFKPYACGTMIHPYIDCMRRLARRGVTTGEIAAIECRTAEPVAAALWEPLEAKRRPRTGYEAKFSMPFSLAVAFLDGDAGLRQFTDERVRDPAVLELAQRISYVVDPANEFPRNYTGHIRVRLRDRREIVDEQPHMRGGRHEPIGRDELVAKFRDNVAHGGWDPRLGEELLEFCLDIERHPTLAGLRAFGR